MRRLFVASFCVALGLGFSGCKNGKLAPEKLRDHQAEAGYFGALMLRSTLPEGLHETVESVHFEVRRRGMATISGKAAYEKGKPIGLRIGSLPAGEGYAVQLALVDKNGNAACAGLTEFSVEAGKNTQVTVVLRCGPNATQDVGGVEINVNAEKLSCPSVAAIVAHPDRAKIGEQVALSMHLHGTPHEELSWNWSLKDTFERSIGSDREIQYTCTQSGSRSIFARVSVGRCSLDREISIDCVDLNGPAVCGNGVLDIGEECDDSNLNDGDDCSSKCEIEVSTGQVSQKGGGVTAGKGAAVEFEEDAFPEETRVSIAFNQVSEFDSQLFDEVASWFDIVDSPVGKMRVAISERPPSSELVKIRLRLSDAFNLSSLDTSDLYALVSARHGGKFIEGLGLPTLVAFPVQVSGDGEFAETEIFGNSFIRTNSESNGGSEYIASVFLVLGKRYSEQAKAEFNSYSDDIKSDVCNATPIRCPLVRPGAPKNCHIVSKVQKKRKHPESGKVRPHHGIDLRAVTGTDVVAARCGIVARSYISKNGLGGTIVLRHKDKGATVYAHLSERLKKKGDKVNAGDVIGKSGGNQDTHPDTAGSSSGPHLHFEYVKSGPPFRGADGKSRPKRVDPEPCLSDTEDTGTDCYPELLCGPCEVYDKETKTCSERICRRPCRKCIKSINKCRPDKSDPTCGDPPPGGSPGSRGDPHFTTLDGYGFDLQSAGEYLLLTSDTGDLVVQARQVPITESASVNAAIVLGVGGDRVGLYADEGENVVLRINGSERALDNEALLLPNGARIRHFPAQKTMPAIYRVVLLDGSVFEIRAVKTGVATKTGGGSILGLSFVLPPSREGKVSGLLGTFDGNADNDIARRGSTVAYKLPVSMADLYSGFAESWRLKPEESLFDYAQGKSTDDYYLPSFPASRLSFQDLDQKTQRFARETCERTQLVSDGVSMDRCLLDVALTRDKQIATAHSPSVDPVIPEIPNVPKSAIITPLPVFESLPLEGWEASGTGDWRLAEDKKSVALYHSSPKKPAVFMSPSTFLGKTVEFQIQVPWRRGVDGRSRVPAIGVVWAAADGGIKNGKLEQAKGIVLYARLRKRGEPVYLIETNDLPGMASIVPWFDTRETPDRDPPGENVIKKWVNTQAFRTPIREWDGVNDGEFSRRDRWEAETLRVRVFQSDDRLFIKLGNQVIYDGPRKGGPAGNLGFFASTERLAGEPIRFFGFRVVADCEEAGCGSHEMCIGASGGAGVRCECAKAVAGEPCRETTPDSFCTLTYELTPGVTSNTLVGFEPVRVKTGSFVQDHAFGESSERDVARPRCPLGGCRNTRTKIYQRGFEGTVTVRVPRQLGGGNSGRGELLAIDLRHKRQFELKRYLETEMAVVADFRQSAGDESLKAIGRGFFTAGEAPTLEWDSCEYDSKKWNPAGSHWWLYDEGRLYVRDMVAKGQAGCVRGVKSTGFLTCSKPPEKYEYMKVCEGLLIPPTGRSVSNQWDQRLENFTFSRDLRQFEMPFVDLPVDELFPGIRKSFRRMFRLTGRLVESSCSEVSP